MKAQSNSGTNLILKTSVTYFHMMLWFWVERVEYITRAKYYRFFIVLVIISICLQSQTHFLGYSSWHTHSKFSFPYKILALTWLIYTLHWTSHWIRMMKTKMKFWQTNQGFRQLNKVNAWREIYRSAKHLEWRFVECIAILEV